MPGYANAFCGSLGVPLAPRAHGAARIQKEQMFYKCSTDGKA